MRLELGANTQQEIDESKGLFVFFNVPHDTPEIRENIRGLILCLAKARYYVNNPSKDVRFGYTAKALDGIEVHFMSDTLLNRGVNSLIEIEFTLKHLLAAMADNKDIQFFIDKPAEPPIDPDTGEWEPGNNDTIQTGRISNFEVGSLLETNSITDVLKIATLDDGTIGFPDINPFNLESKLDQIRSDITEAKDLHEWFASAFWSGRFSDLNPFAYETFFQRFSATFNTHYTATQIIRENLHGMLARSFNESDDSAQGSYFRVIPNFVNLLMSEVISKLDGIMNAILGLSLNPTITNEVNPTPVTIQNTVNCDNSGVQGAMESVATAINNQTDSQNSNSQNSNTQQQQLNDLLQELTNATTNNNSNASLQEIIEAIRELTEVSRDNGCETIDDGNGKFTTTPKDKPDYPLLDESQPDLGTIEPYKRQSVAKNTNNHDAICGFIWYACNWLADLIEWLLELGPFEYMLPLIAQQSGLNAAVAYLQATPVAQNLITSTGGTSLVQTGTALAKLTPSYLRPIVGQVSSLRVFVLNDISLSIGAQGAAVLSKGALIGTLLNLIPALLRAYADELACGNTNESEDLFEDWSTNKFINSILEKLTSDFIVDTGLLPLLNPLIAQEKSIAFIGMLLNMGIETAFMGSAGEKLSDYAQYCPCPMEGNFSGHWWNGITGHGEIHYFLDATGSGDGWSHDGLSTKIWHYTFISVINSENELIFNGTGTVNENGSHFPFNGVLNEIGGTELTVNGDLFTKV